MNFKEARRKVLKEQKRNYSRYMGRASLMRAKFHGLCILDRRSCVPELTTRRFLFICLTVKLIKPFIFHRLSAGARFLQAYYFHLFYFWFFEIAFDIRLTTTHHLRTYLILMCSRKSNWVLPLALTSTRFLFRAQ